MQLYISVLSEVGCPLSEFEFRKEESLFSAFNATLGRAFPSVDFPPHEEPPKESTCRRFVSLKLLAVNHLDNFFAIIGSLKESNLFALEEDKL